MTQENAQASWDDESRWSEDMDTQEHLQTYSGFLTATKYGTIAVVVILVLMAITLL